MYLRWKRRQHLRDKWGTRAAVLVETHRVNGKPRQRVVCYLASINEQHIDRPVHRASFWQSVDWHLDKLALAEPVRATVEAKLQETVPKPTEAEQAEYERLAQRYGFA